MANFLSRIFSKNQSSSFLKKMAPLVAKAGVLETDLKNLSDNELIKRAQEVRVRSANDVPSEDVPLVLALVREASRRTLGERHYDVQLLGGLALAEGKIAEMRTGEGKTLVATIPVTLAALVGRGVHVVTVNDYLARRDATWMGQVYNALGLSVGVVTATGSYRYDPTHIEEEEDAERDVEGAFRVFYNYLRPVTKREAYSADITYATNNELGFDYLRDNTAYEESQLVQRGHAFAIVDEIDSILIDEARTPLIISGPAGDTENLYERFAHIASSMVRDEDYTVDEKQKAVQMTDSGMQKAERALGIENLYAEGGMKYAHLLETAVRATALFQKDKEYVVKREGNKSEVVIVDEFTGRLQPGRRWSEGLHQAIEAKEGVQVRAETRTYASVTFQNYFRMYDQLSGMTGTALSAEEEFFTVYGLEVVVVPTNKPIARKDYDDLIFQTSAGKYKALARDIARRHKKGQPVLVGTVSIEDNEIISQYLEDSGVPHEVLNAKNHEQEGEIIAQAGKLGRVTVATNLAGRGVDIKLGGVPANNTEREAVLAVGGLAVIGTERHDARRIDDQLRGRAGRQGDVGETRFYVSLEDKLMRVFASDMLKKVMGSFKIPEDEPIESSMITKSLETAQKRIEGFNFDSRKQVLAYDDVLNTQRLAIYKRRREAVLGSSDDVEEAVAEMIATKAELTTLFMKKKEEIGAEGFVVLLRRLLLQATDTLWLEHLETMDYLRRSVSLRAYGQRDPLIEYRKEGLTRFRQMENEIVDTIQRAFPQIAPADEERIRMQEEKTRASLVTVGSDGNNKENAQAQIKKGHTYGRNDTITITKDGKTQTVKFKKAEPLLDEGWTVTSSGSS